MSGEYGGQLRGDHGGGLYGKHCGWQDDHEGIAGRTQAGVAQLLPREDGLEPANCTECGVDHFAVDHFVADDQLYAGQVTVDLVDVPHVDQASRFPDEIPPDQLCHRYFPFAHHVDPHLLFLVHSLPQPLDFSPLISDATSFPGQTHSDSGLAQPA